MRFHIGKRAETMKARSGKAGAPKKVKVPKTGEKAASNDAEAEDAPATPPALEPRSRSLRERKPSAVSVRPLSTLPIRVYMHHLRVCRTAPLYTLQQSDVHSATVRPWPTSCALNGLQSDGPPIHLLALVSFVYWHASMEQVICMLTMDADL